MAESPVATLRHFNRAWSQRVGALDDSFLGSGRPLAPSRLLFEISSDGVGVRTLRRRLGLDSGYLSRLLRQLGDEGLVEVVPDPGDGRRRVARLTPRGRRERRKVDDRSEQLAQALVAPLTPTQRVRLDEALATAELLLRAATVALEPVDPRSPDAVAAVSAYFVELERRFEDGFDPGGALIEDAPHFSAPYGVFVLARGDDEVAACGGVQRLDGTTAEIKRMWVHPGWRGVGLGVRMLRHLEVEAARLGHDVVRLDTNSALTEAITLYERSGYRSIERYNDNPYARRWFEKRLDDDH